MKIVLSNIYAEVVEATVSEHSWLDQVLRWEDASARHRKFYKGDGFIHLYDQMNQVFPAGFMRQVYDAAKQQGQKLKIADKRKKPCQRDKEADLRWLRDYQVEAVEAAIKRTRGILWCPTGSGKTEIAIGLTKALPCSWLFLAHRADLVHQAAARFEKRTGEKAGIIGDGIWDPSGFTAATFQTFYRKLKKGDQDAIDILSNVQGLIIDEVHTLPANSYLGVSQGARNAYYRIGMSGTPLARGDQKSMHVIGACGPVIYRLQAQKLIDEGVLAKPKIRMKECRQGIQLPPMANSRQRAKIWAKVNRQLIIESEPRNLLILDMVKQAAKPCLVFVTQLDHGWELDRAIRNSNIQCEFVNGNKVTAQRLEAIKRLERGDADVLICTVIFNEGVDIPELRSVVIAGGGKSTIAALQRVGRGMRTAGGTKNEFEVWDVKDTGSMLENHAKARRRAYAVEGYEVEDG